MEQVMLDMIPTGAKAVCHVSQYDIGRTIRFNLISGGAVYTLSGTETIKVYIKKPDGTTAERNIANTSSTYVDWVTGEGDCDVAGKCECELVITSGTTVIGSKNFTVKVEEDPYNDQGVVTETAGPAIIATFTTNVVDTLQEVKCSINPIQDLHGYNHPWPAGDGKNKINPDTVELSALTVSDGVYSASDGDNRDTLFFKLQGFLGNTYAGYQVTTPPIVRTGKISLKITIPNNIDKLRFANAGQSNEFTFRFPCPFPEGTVATFSCYILDITIGAVKFKEPQLEIGDTATAYEPYENVCPISGGDELNIQRCGVNLFDKTNSNQVIFGYIWVTQIASAQNMRTVLARCKPSTQYTVSKMAGQRFIVGYTKELPDINVEVFSAITDNTATHISITTGDDAKYIVAFVYNGNVDSGTADEMVASVQIAEGTDITYHSYSGKLIKLEFDNTVYLAEVSCLNGVWKLKPKSRVLTFAELATKNWAVSNSGIFYLYPLATACPDILMPIVNLPMCSHFAYQRSETMEDGTFRISDALYIKTSQVETVADFKTWLANNNGLIEYEIATPVEITLDETEQFEALLGVNNVWHDGNGDTEVKYLYNA